MKEQDQQQIAAWVELILDDKLPTSDFELLERRLSEDPEMRELYLDLMHQHAHLQLERVYLSSGNSELSGDSDDDSDQKVERKLDDNPARSRRTSAVLAVVLAVAACIIFMMWLGRQPESEANPSSIAKLIDSAGAVWGDCTLPTVVGSELVAGRLKIERGLATVHFASGAQVTLEAPAELELEDSLHGTLLTGTAVINVPESAHGFTITTPTAIAIDHGTSFAVTVNANAKTSTIEVLEGLVEVQHAATDTTRRLKEREKVVASETALNDSAQTVEAELVAQTSRLPAYRDIQRITTSMGKGRDASVRRGDSREHESSELILVKNPFKGYEDYRRKGYLAFDLSALVGDRVTFARLALTLEPSGFGFASRVPDCEFTVYGLINETLDDWTASDLTWESAPANLDGAAELDADRVKLLGRFTVARGQQHGQVSIEGQQLVDFLNSDTNGTATLIIARNTVETDAGGLVHAFASRLHPTALPPTLLLRTKGSGK